jgi:hypothetical protein
MSTDLAHSLFPWLKKKPKPQPEPRPSGLPGEPDE